MIKDYFLIAVKSLTKRKTRTYLTMIGIFIGIAAVIALIGLGEGLRVAITSQFGFLGTDVLGVQAAGVAAAGPPGSGAINPLTSDLAEKIEKISGVEAAFNRYLSAVTLEFNDKQKIEFAISIPSGTNRKTLEKMVNLKTSQGRLLTDADRKKVLVGDNYAQDSSFGTTFGRPLKAGDRIILNGVDFEVVGIIEKKGSFIFDDAVWMDEDEMIEYGISDEERVSTIAVKVSDVNEIGKVQLAIEKFLRKERGVEEGEEDFSVETPQSALESLNSTLYAVQLFVTIIAVISLLVGGIGIMNTMYTAVLERTKEIGIMKSLGARNSTIFTLFFIESGLLGMIGGIIGVILGLSFAYGAAAAGKTLLGSDLIQASVSWSLIFGSLAFSFILGTAFGVLPAYQASRLNPVDSLRKVK
ncbi:ABC transporter permease [Candidatus Woesearchaeota archaeon]|nr:ABC transporter permease [Candidatus Woesearchaeota archaeon]